jgi:hypothetical protein
MRAEEAAGYSSTGGDFTHTKPSGWANLPGNLMASAPQLLQERYTDNSIIPVVVTNVVTVASTTRPRYVYISPFFHPSCKGCQSLPLPTIS